MWLAAEWSGTDPAGDLMRRAALTEGAALPATLQHPSLSLAAVDTPTSARLAASDQAALKPLSVEICASVRTGRINVGF